MHLFLCIISRVVVRKQTQMEITVWDKQMNEAATKLHTRNQVFASVSWEATASSTVASRIYFSWFHNYSWLSKFGHMFYVPGAHQVFSKKECVFGMWDAKFLVFEKLRHLVDVNVDGKDDGWYHVEKTC